MTQATKYGKDDFAADGEVRWCPGCGDYSILAQVQRVMPEICEQLQLQRENIVFISGIGCSSRFPYYMKTFGFHTIHGRAPAIATGLQLTRPDLQVWVVTGDGDGLSIGTNHIVHCLRRNINVRILLFNNRIYGLTKGQFSPTSEKGKLTKSSPMGSIEHPINPVSFAIASEATFVARAIATDTANLRQILLRAARHRGSAFVEILQNCNVFNDGAFDSFAASAVRSERCIFLGHGQPLTFGAKGDRAISLRAGHPEIVNVADHPETRLLRFKEDSAHPGVAYMLSQLDEQDFPVPMGVFRCVEKELYGEALDDQVERAVSRRGKGDYHQHIRSGETWEVYS
ncbi:MAG: 2-oxoacid:ferredoxin oxidoreductase subunit beta [Gammaproteobacteria bacterium]|nr:2-oxoacid:ferredoxin oxidoreductase subunit beta [Gammaproteobacteria bacterium]MDH5275420.1 2-oxoacid:ferredoxin oxidoreductase subunit beta [Gammaproteobacteria bacterium]